MKIVYVLLFLLLSNKMYCQKFDKSYFGTWINTELKSKLDSNLPKDSSLKIVPRFIYIKNFNSIEVNLRFEQRKISYRIQKVDSNNIYIQRGKVILMQDSILMHDKYFGRIKFVRYKQ